MIAIATAQSFQKVEQEGKLEKSLVVFSDWREQGVNSRLEFVSRCTDRTPDKLFSLLQPSWGRKPPQGEEPEQKSQWNNHCLNGARQSVFLLSQMENLLTRTALDKIEKSITSVLGGK